MLGTNRTTKAVAAAVTAITVAVTGALATAEQVPATASADEGWLVTDDDAAVVGMVRELEVTTGQLDSQCEGWRDGDQVSVDDGTCAGLLDELESIEIRLLGGGDVRPARLEPVGPRHVETPVETGP